MHKHALKKKIKICMYPCGYTCVKAKTLKRNNIFPLWHVKMWYKEAHYTVLTKTPIHQVWLSLTFGVFSTSVSHSVSQLLSAVWQKEEMSANRFFRELGAVMSAFAVTDEVVRSDGQLQSFLSPRACLALTLCAMFSEGTRHSAVTQTGRQMVRIDSEHERDWQSSNNP